MTAEEESSKGRSVVDDDPDEFQDIDRDEVAIIIVSKVELGLPNDFFWPINIPPKFELDAKTASAVESCVT